MVLIKKISLKPGRILQVSMLALSFSCSNIKKNRSHESVPDSNVANGKILAAKYCQSCHLLPDPSLLNSASWEEGVLPQMGPRLGIFKYGTKNYPSSRRDMNLSKNFYPDKPLLSEGEWQNIIDYYTSVSPDSLPGQQRRYPVEMNTALFKIEMPALKKNIPTTCFVQIDTFSSSRQVLVSDMITKNIFRYNNHLQLIDSFQNTSPLIDMERHRQNIIACNIGIMFPNNGKYGTVFSIAPAINGKLTIDSSLHFDNLARPVQVSSADFNKDGKTDYLICEFGNLTGALSWLENRGNHKYERHIIREVPGAIKAYVTDINHDGLPDIWALFAQGDEGIFLFTNKGNGKFVPEEVLRFQPIFGSSYFEMADINKDGHPDIIYTCGDNADYSAVLKPYHGIYIFINDGTNHFKQQYFFPMHGCFKAMARDFDGDGDLDIAAISFFGDFVNHPEESFVYLENKGKLVFKSYSIPGTTSGRWLTMDAADLDNDGKTDILLGNFSIAPSFLKQAASWKNGPPFIILKNIIPINNK